MKKWNNREIKILSYSYIVFPLIFLLFLIYFSFMQNFNTSYGRYQYTGSETMSLLGLLDLAHYRPIASEEFWGWQFFFGNLPFLFICAFYLAGIFHLYQINLPESQNVGNFHILGRNKQVINKLTFIFGIFILIIMVLEIIAAMGRQDEIGLGSHLYIGTYYQNIPTLINQGFYVVNSLSAHSQTFLSFIPFFFGSALFPLLFGLQILKKKGYKISFSMNFMSSLYFFLSLGPYLILLLKSDLSICNSFTSYSLILMIIWFFVGLVCSGILLLIIKNSNPSSISKFINLKKFLKKNILSGILCFIIFLGIILFAFLLLSPYLELLNFENNLNIPGLNILLILDCMIIICCMILIGKKEKFRVLTFQYLFSLNLSFFLFLLMLVIASLNPNFGFIEIAWFFNSIIPLCFTVCLTLEFYFLGIQLKFFVTNRLKTLDFKHNHHEFWKIFNKKKNLKVSFISLLMFASLIPFGAFLKLYGEEGQILINNLGFLPNQSKSFFFTTKYDHQTNGSFQIYDENTNNLIFSGNLVRKGSQWDRYHWSGDFTNLTHQGSYYIKAKIGIYSAQSYNFDIDENYLDRAFSTGLYWYYYTRCGTQVHEVIPGYLGHEACHTHDAWFIQKNNDSSYEYVHANDVGMNLTGGWHDSGDYNVYGGVRVPPLSYSLVWTFNQVPNFFMKETQMSSYPENNSIPDIIEEAWFGVQFWLRRWYEPEQKWFDSTNLGKNGDLRWTVFGAPEYEEDFGKGRWIDDDDEGAGEQTSYDTQFVNSSNGLLVVAALASFVEICRNYGYYQENLTQIENLIAKAYSSYAKFLGNNYQSLLVEMELYEFEQRVNISHYSKACQIANYYIQSSNNSLSFPDSLTYAYVLDFAQKYDQHLSWNGLDYIFGNNSITVYNSILKNRTQEMFGFLRDKNQGNPVYHNGVYFSAMMAASFAWNITKDAEIKQNLFNFITNHYDWTFGRNIENICMVEGINGGENTVYQYSSTRYKYIPGNLRGASPGFIPDGFEYFPEMNNNENPISRTTNLYTEVWSDVIFRYMEMNAAFYKEILNYA